MIRKNRHGTSQTFTGRAVRISRNWSRAKETGDRKVTMHDQHVLLRGDGRGFANGGSLVLLIASLSLFFLGGEFLAKGLGELREKNLSIMLPLTPWRWSDPMPPTDGIGLSVVGGLATLPALICLGKLLWDAYLAFLSRRWITFLPEGLVVIRARMFRNEDVTSMSVLRKGRARAKIWIKPPGSAPEFLLQWHATASGADVLCAWFERISTKIYQRARADFEAGRVLSGEGWELSREGLRLLKPQATTASAMALGDLQVGLVSHHVCGWVSRLEQPVLCLADEERNTRVLFHLLREKIPPRRVATSAPA
jgi:hypothetical protein